MSAPIPHAARSCATCRASTGDLPFCPRDGTLVEPFVLGERYRIDELIGGGGFGLVFGARHVLLGKAVAVKVLRPEHGVDELQRRRFLREARTSSQLAHENIVGILDFGSDDALGVSYLVMERLRGATLHEVIRDHGALPARRALPILLQLARALAAAHAAGVVHRDLNPRNVVLIETSGRVDVVKLCDFGLSRLVDGRDRVTAAGVVVGTPAYMAPEQIRGDAHQDHRVDLHAFGVTAYEMLTGQPPTGLGAPAAVIARKLAVDPDGTLPLELDGVPPAVATLIERCLHRDPDERPADAGELIAVLAAAVAPPSGGDRAATPTTLVGQRVGHYVITELLETGGVGAVYIGHHPLIGTKVAIKVLLPEMAAVPGMSERFILEARAASQLVSPHAPRYYDFGHLPGGQPYAVMELLEGETLARRLGRIGALEIDDVREILDQLASVIALAHAAGIVHRDIKPENVFLTRDPAGQVVTKLLDFGIAKSLTTAASGTKTGIGIMLGTPAYCAPEQAMGQDVGPAADVYALGVTAFEMLSGRLPFEGEVPEMLGAKTCHEAPSLHLVRPDLPRTVVDTVARMVVRDPARRIGSMGEVRAALVDWNVTVAIDLPIPGELDEPDEAEVVKVASASPSPMPSLPAPPSVAQPWDPGTPPQPPASRRGWLIGAVAVTTVGLIVAFAMIVSPTPAARRDARPPATRDQAPAPTRPAPGPSPVVIPLEPAEAAPSPRTPASAGQGSVAGPKAMSAEPEKPTTKRASKTKATSTSPARASTKRTTKRTPPGPAASERPARTPDPPARKPDPPRSPSEGVIAVPWSKTP